MRGHGLEFSILHCVVVEGVFYQALFQSIVLDTELSRNISSFSYRFHSNLGKIGSPLLLVEDKFYTL